MQYDEAYIIARDKWLEEHEYTVHDVMEDQDGEYVRYLDEEEGVWKKTYIGDVVSRE